MSYLMSPREDQKRSLIDAQTLIAALGRQWPAADVSTFSPAERVYVVEWRMTLSHGLLLGGFSRNGQAISLDGDLEDCAEVALWFRTLIAADTRLWFYDQGYNYDIEVTPATTARQIVDAFVDASS